MYLNDFYTWKDAAAAHWQGVINNSGYTNKDQLLNSLDSQLGSLATSYQNYINGSSENKVKDLLIPVFAYIMIRYKKEYLEPVPSIGDLMENNDLRTLYTNWTYELPSDYGTVFTLVSSGSPGEGVLGKAGVYYNVESAINNGNSTDNDQLGTIPHHLYTVTKDVNIHLTFKPVKTRLTDIDPKNFALEEMHLDEILEVFNFSISGVNI